MPRSEPTLSTDDVSDLYRLQWFDKRSYFDFSIYATDRLALIKLIMHMAKHFRDFKDIRLFTESHLSRSFAAHKEADSTINRWIEVSPLHLTSLEGPEWYKMHRALRRDKKKYTDDKIGGYDWWKTRQQEIKEI